MAEVPCSVYLLRFPKATLCDYLTGRRTNKTNLRYLEEV